MSVTRYGINAQGVFTNLTDGGYVSYQDYEKLAAENVGLKAAAVFAMAPDMWEELGGNVMRYQYQEWYADRLKSAMETPATDAFLAEVRAQGVEMLTADRRYEWMDSYIDDANEFAALLRKGVQS